MGASASLAAKSVAVACGETATVTVTIRNTGTVVDQFHVDVLGDPGAWSRVDPPEVSLLPGREATVTVTFAPPRDPTTPHGDIRFGVRALPQEDPGGVTVEEGVLTVSPYADVRAEILPQMSNGWRTGGHEVSIANRGNATVHIGCTGTDPNGALRIGVALPSAANVGPGTAVRAKVRVRAKDILWKGQARTLPFTVQVRAVAPPGVPPMEPVALSASLNQRAIIPPTLPRTLATIAALLLGAIVAWALVVKPSIQETARNEVAAPLATTDQNLRKVADKVGVEVAPINGEATATPSPGTSGGTSELGLPVSERLVVSAPPGGEPVGSAFKLDSGRALTVLSLLLQNPFGDKGLLVVGVVPQSRAGRDVGEIPEDDRLIVVSLEDLTTQPVAFSPAVVLPAGRTVAISVTCDTAGSEPGGGDECEVATLVNGYSRNAPAPTPSPT